MNYLIQEVMVGQIVVKFEDGSRAIIGVQTTNTAEEIDHLVSFYDPDFLPEPETEVNPHVFVGEERQSQRLLEEEEALEETVEVDSTQPAIAPLDDTMVMYYSQHFASLGDNRIRDRFHGMVDSHYSSPTPEAILAYLDKVEESKRYGSETPAEAQAAGEDIFAQALEELGNV